MEILNHQDYMIEDFIAIGIFLSTITLVTILLLISEVLDGVKRNLPNVITTSILSILFGMLAFMSFMAVETETHYEATITDFNEVYTQGYEIIEQRGSIYVLRKATE